MISAGKKEGDGMTQYTVLVTDDDQDIRDGIEIYMKKICAAGHPGFCNP